MTALERQHDGTGFRRLGDVLVEMGLLAEGTLQAVVRRRMEELVGELLAWKSGFFRFEPAAPGGDADVEVDLGDFVLPGGVPPQELLMRAVAALDHARPLPPPAAADAAAPAAVRGPRGRSPSPPRPGPTPRTTSARPSCRCCASPRSSWPAPSSSRWRATPPSGVGEFGVRLPGGRSGAEAVRQTVLSLREPSILRAAVERRRTYAGPLEPTRVNLALAERLGGGAGARGGGGAPRGGGRGALRPLRRQRAVGTAARPARDARVLGGAGRAHHREDARRAREGRGRPARLTPAPRARLAVANPAGPGI